MTFWKSVGAIVLGGVILLVGYALVTDYQIDRMIAKVEASVKKGKGLTVPAKVEDAECLKAEAGMRMLVKPAAHAIRVRNPNTGKCTWEY